MIKKGKGYVFVEKDLIGYYGVFKFDLSYYSLFKSSNIKFIFLKIFGDFLCDMVV